MARARPDDPAESRRQLTLDDWAELLSTTRERVGESRGESAPIGVLADALAPRLAEELARRIPAASGDGAVTPSRMLTLDELVAQLPTAKRPQTWKRWLYERTRRGEVPGCVKLGGMLFFDREPALSWLRAGAVNSTK